MNAYHVTYDGLWLGGTAVVLAESPDHAKALVAADPKTVSFKRVKVELITADLSVPAVLHNDNGDY